jgi:DNA transformation protein
MQPEPNPAPDWIEELPGLGPKSRAMLAAAGITTRGQLLQLGAVRAYARVLATPGNNASLNLLWALEGALTGLHWRVVAKEHRLSLLLALEAVQNAATAPVRPSGRVSRRADNSSKNSA